MMSLNKNQKTTLIWYHDNEAYLQFHMSELPIIINLYVYIYILCNFAMYTTHTVYYTITLLQCFKKTKPTLHIHTSLHLT